MSAKKNKAVDAREAETERHRCEVCGVMFERWPDQPHIVRCDECRNAQDRSLRRREDLVSIFARGQR